MVNDDETDAFRFPNQIALFDPRSIRRMRCDIPSILGVEGVETFGPVPFFFIAAFFDFTFLFGPIGFWQ